MTTLLFCMPDQNCAQQVISYLEKADYTVSYAKWINEAFQILHQSPESYDLVLSEMSLLGGTNLDLMKRCSNYSQTANTPFLIMAYPPNENESYHEWLAKPIKYEFTENGRDAYIVAFWWQKEFILPAIRAVLERQAAQAKSKTGE